MLIVAGLVSLVLGFLFVRERCRRRAVEWDVTASDQEADRLRAAVESCRLRTGEAIAERDKAIAERDGYCRELESARKTWDGERSDLTERLRGTREAREVRDERLGFLVEWVETEVKPLVGPRRAA